MPWIARLAICGDPRYLNAVDRSFGDSRHLNTGDRRRCLITKVRKVWMAGSLISVYDMQAAHVIVHILLVRSSYVNTIDHLFGDSRYLNTANRQRSQIALSRDRDIGPMT